MDDRFNLPETIATSVPQESPENMGGEGLRALLQLLKEKLIDPMRLPVPGMPYSTPQPTLAPEEPSPGILDDYGLRHPEFSPTQEVVTEPPRPIKKSTAKGTPKKGGVASDNKAAPTSSSTPTSPTAPEPGAITQFLNPEFTQPTNVEGELTNILNALPQRLEDLAGPRPQAQRPTKWWQQLLALPFLGAVGTENFYQQKDKALERPWKEQMAFAKERADLVKEFKLKALDYKMTQNKEMRDREEKAYAKLGEDDPSLGQNLAYRAGLYKDLPANVREKLIQEAVDPKTGQFKTGSPLYVSPEKKFRYKLEEVRLMAEAMGITDQKEQARLAVNPEEFMKSYYGRLDSLEKQIAYYLEQPDTPQNRAQIARIQAIKKSLETKAGDVPDYIKVGQNVAYFNQERAKQKQYAKNDFKTHKDKARLQQDENTIDDYFNNLIDLSYTHLGGKGYAIALRGRKGKGVEYPPEYAMLMESQPDLNPDIVGKPAADKNYKDVRNTIERVASHPSGVDVDLWAQQNLGPIELPIYRSLWTSWIQKFGSTNNTDLLAEAAKKYGNIRKVPFRQLYQAITILHTNPDQKDAIRRALLGAK